MKKGTPEAIFIVTLWRLIMEQADTISGHYKWLLSVKAAILALIIVNLKSVESIVSTHHLRACLALLVGSILLSTIAYLLSLAGTLSHKASLRVESVMSTPEGQATIEEMTIGIDELKEELCTPFFGPLKWNMESAFQKGVDDPFFAEKRPLRILTWQIYTMGTSILTATFALLILIIGIKS